MIISKLVFAMLCVQKYIQENGITSTGTIRRQGSVLSLSAMSQASSTSFKLQVCAISVRSGGEYDVVVVSWLCYVVWAPWWSVMCCLWFCTFWPCPSDIMEVHSITLTTVS